MDRQTFYFVLCRGRLPALWAYYHACVLRAQSTRHGTEYLGNSVLFRCVRALQARDEIGVRILRQQDNGTRDEVAYHFDYLTLLLTGALDAQARIARLFYGLTAINVRATSFKSGQFLKALVRAGGQDLAKVAQSDRFKAFTRLLTALRNAVHGAGLHPVSLLAEGKPERSVLSVIEGASDVWEAASYLNVREAMGLKNFVGVTLEPYGAARVLVDLGLEFVNAVASATEVQRWTPSGVALLTGPPEDPVVTPEARQRIEAMG